MAALVLILLIVACVNPENRLTPEEFSVASNWTTDGLVAAVTLIIAIACGKFSTTILRRMLLKYHVSHAFALS
jgi:hypothetical protein